MLWVSLGVAILCLPPLLALAGLVYLYRHIVHHYLPVVVRIFQEKPLFVVPRGEALADAEEVRLRTADGVELAACYLHTPLPRRKGVVLFGLEYGSNRWSCRPYCDPLLAAGYDVFTYEPRNQADSGRTPGYEPLQWHTKFEQLDAEAALDYLVARPDADPRGVGLYGISKGGTAGLDLASRRPEIRCAVTDGAFGIYTTMVPYMRKWVAVYSPRHKIQTLIPNWLYKLIAVKGLADIARERRVQYVPLESSLRRLDVPFLMIHGAKDTYIKTGMARDLLRKARGLKEFWLVENAKHNQAHQIAGEEYRRRIVAFLDRHLGALPGGAEPTPEPEPAPRVPAAVAG